MQDIPRDRFNRPLVVPPGGGKVTAYTRATTLAGTLEDTYNLGLWQQRQVAIGLVDRDDLRLAVSAHRDDKNELNKITEKAKEAAGSSTKATTGTALHALTELVDQGQPLPAISPEALRDLEAYRVVTSGLTVKGIEQFVVLDDIKVAGTFDRLVELDGQHYIADLKTGSIEWGLPKIATQLAVYSRGKLYEHPGKRSDLPNVNQEWGLIIHLPAGQGKCSFRWVDLTEGWNGALLAIEARKWRKAKVGRAAEAVLVAAVRAAPDVDTLTALYHATPSEEWTDAVNDSAKEVRARLEAA